MPKPDTYGYDEDDQSTNNIQKVGGTRDATAHYATRPDATNVAHPNYREMQRLSAKVDSLQREHTRSMKSVSDMYEGVGMKASPAAFLGEAMSGNRDAKTAIRTEGQIESTSNALAKARRRKG